MATLDIPPAGVYELGFYSPEDYEPIPDPPVIRADLIKARSQEFESLTKDMDPIDAQVVDAIWRVRESGAAVMNDGARFLDVSKIDDQAPNRVRSQVRTSLGRLTSNGDITLKNVEVTSGADWMEVEIDYVNNRTALANKTRKLRTRLPEASSW